jgi:hypothetical protein
VEPCLVDFRRDRKDVEESGSSEASKKARFLWQTNSKEKK